MRRKSAESSSANSRRRNIAVSAALVLLFAAVVGGMFAFTDRRLLAEALRRITPPEVLFLLLVTGASLALRVLRWKLLLEASGVDVGLKQAAPPLVAGQAASLVTPAKAGDFLRCVFLRRRSSIPFGKTIGSLFVERLFDLLVIIAFAASFVAVFKGPSSFAIIAAMIVMLAIILLTAGAFWFPPLSRLVFDVILRGKFRDVPESVARIHREPAFYAAALLTIPIWTVDFGRIYLEFLFLGFSGIGPLAVFQTMAISVIVGIVSTIPGGLGSSEIASITLFSLQGVPSYISSAALILDRLTGFWPVVAAGAAVSATMFRRQPRRKT